MAARLHNKFRFDTVENEPAKNLQNFAKKVANFPNFANPAPGRESGGTSKCIGAMPSMPKGSDFAPAPCTASRKGLSNLANFCPTS